MIIALSELTLDSFANALLLRDAFSQTDGLVRLFIYALVNDVRKLRLKLSADGLRQVFLCMYVEALSAQSDTEVSLGLFAQGLSACYLSLKL